MKCAAKIFIRSAKALLVVMTFFFEIHIESTNVEVAKSSAQEAVRSRDTAKSTGADPIKLTKEEQQNGGIISPYEACKGFVMVPHSEYQKPYWQDRVRGKCDAKAANCQLKVQTIPDGSMFGSFDGKAGENMTGNTTATAFLNSIRDEASTRLTKGISEREAVLSACKSSMTSDRCRPFLESTKSKLAKNEAEFREVVAVLAEPKDADLMRVIVSNDVSYLINRRLASATGPIQTLVNVPKMNPLTDEEFASIKKELEDLVQKARAEWKVEVDDTIKKRLQSGMPESRVEEARRNLMKEEVFKTKLRRSISEMQSQKLRAYDRIAAEVPEMPFIGTANPDSPTFLTGLSQVIESLKQAQTIIGKPLNPKDLSSEDKLGEVLQYASFHKLIESKLEDENRRGTASSCAVATAVQQRLIAVQDRNRLYALGIGVGGLVVGGVAGAGSFSVKVANLLRAGGMGGMIGNGSLISFAGGVAALTQDIAYESMIKSDLELGAKGGFIAPEKVREQVGAVTLSALLAPLDFLGGSSAIVGSALALKNANRIGRVLGDSTIGRFVTASIATNSLEQATAKSQEVVKLMTTLQNAKEGSREAIEAENRLKLAVNSTARSILGRQVAAEDEVAMKALAQGYLGSPEKPLVTVFRDYAELTKDMSQADRKAYAERLDALTKSASGSEVALGKAPASTARAPKADPGLQEANARLAVELAAEPGYEATAEVMKPGSGWTREAISNLREVVASARAQAKGSKEVVSVRFRKALARITGQAEDSVHNKKLACCAGVDACTVGERFPERELDELEAATQPVLMACVNH